MFLVCLETLICVFEACVSEFYSVELQKSNCDNHKKEDRYSVDGVA